MSFSFERHRDGDWHIREGGVTISIHPESNLHGILEETYQSYQEGQR